MNRIIILILKESIMKRIILILAILLISTEIFAQDKDHFIIGRLKDSKLVKFELKNYEKFYIPLGKIEKRKFSKLDSVEGKIERRLYKPKKVTTVLEVYKNYLSYLKQINAEILYKANDANEIGEGFGDVYYSANPMMGLVYRNTLPYSFTVVEKTAQAFISAKLSKDGKDFYINLIVGNGYEPYTMYQLDIVETKKMDGAIMIVNNNISGDSNSDNSTGNKSNKNIALDNNGKSKNVVKPLFKMQVGYTHYKLTSPQLFGGRVSTQDEDIFGGSLEGFRELDGFEYEMSYFINKNISIDASYGTFSGENSLGIDNNNSNEYHSNKGEISYIKLGATGTITGKDYPVKLSFSTGAGNAKIKAIFDNNYYFSDGSNSDYSRHYEGESHFILIYFQTQLSVPITNGIYLFTEYEYNIGISGELTMSDSSNNEYHEINYENPGFGGNLLKVGIGYEFSVK
jgi:hypothetical protein